MEKIKNLFSQWNPTTWLPYPAAIVLFLLISLIYVSPVLQGKRLVQSDIIKYQGMSKEITDFRQETGEEPLWTNAMFGGMPAFQISVRYSNNISNALHQLMTLGLPRPADMIFLYFAGFFIFLLLLRVNPWIALAGAVGFAFSSYHFIILEAGHNSKAVAIGYMAPVLGSIIYTFRGKLLWGSILFAVFMGLQLFANHFQITYYLGMMVLIYGIFLLVKHIQEKRLGHFLRATGVLLAGLVVAVGLNAGNLWSTYTYASETMRGGSELSLDQEQQTTGLSKDYITSWSYGKKETFSLLIPNVKGGATGPLGNNERAMDRIDPQLHQIVSGENQYWGNQPFTSGSVYVGAVVLFFFVLSLFLLKGPLKWVLLAATVLSVLLAWGRNFMPLTEFFIDHVPAYNKFRAVSMTLVIAELCIPALAFLGLNELYKNPGRLHIKSQGLWTAIGLTAGISLLFYLAPKLFFDFFSLAETQTFNELSAGEPVLAAQISEFIRVIEQARIFIFRADTMRSLLFALGAAVLVMLFIRRKLAPGVFITLVVVLLTIDMWPVNKRYLDDSSFQPRRRAEVPFPLRQADALILQDQEGPFRVLDLTESPFNSSRTSYYHHSIGGYHGAKLQRYQDLIDHQITPEMVEMGTVLQLTSSLDSVRTLFPQLSALNMLNTRYFITNPETAPQLNPHALGNAWFVENFRIVNNADEEIQALGEIDPAKTAVVDQRFDDHLQGKTLQPDPGADIDLVHYQPNKLRYRYTSRSEQLAVFSEIYYPDGWKVFIDGDEASHFRANYVLRAMVLPAGAHEVEFRFEPRSYFVGEKISLAFSILLVLIVAGAGGWHIRRMLKD
ncbi:MAG: hypothetical protein R6U86_00905 [Bacteroidales bacterium]